MRAPLTKDWRNFALVYHRLGPPLRPSAGDIAIVKRAISGHQRQVLLLGVTPELAVLGTDLTAVDGSPAMIADIWPGDSGERRAILADWTNLPFGDSTFDAVIGDGSLNSAAGQVGQVVGEIRRVLAPAGTAAFRVFCSPERAETLQSIEQEVTAGWADNLHALKWRIAMALAAARPGATVPVQDILAAFNRMFPDRPALAARTGWSMDEISTIDAYQGAGHSLAFPTLRDMLDLAAPYFSSASVEAGGGYPLSDRCPTIIWGAG